MSNPNLDHQALLNALSDHIMATQLAQQQEQQRSSYQLAQQQELLRHSILFSSSINNEAQQNNEHAAANYSSISNMIDLSLLSPSDQMHLLQQCAAPPGRESFAPAASGPILPPPPPSYPQHISFPNYAQLSYNTSDNQSHQMQSSFMRGQVASETERTTTQTTINDGTSRTSSTSNMRSRAVLKNEREQVFCFVKILFKLLKHSDEDQLSAHCKRIVRECTLRNRQGDPDFVPLVACLRRRLRPVIGERYWQRAETVLRRSLEQMALREQEAAAAIPTAV